jgi:branched-chain amino acid transport system substrate-binding protein
VRPAGARSCLEPIVRLKQIDGPHDFRNIMRMIAILGRFEMKSIGLAAVAIGCLLVAAPASAQAVKIGILNDQSGVYADYGGKYSVEAAKMAIEDFGGTVLGEKIELITGDHQNKPDLAASIARRWYDVEHVDMITELTTSSVALAVQELSKEKKKIDIVVGAATSRITGDACTPYGFHWAFDTHALAVGTGGALVKAGGDSWFFLTADYAFGYALEKDTSEIVTASGGKVLGSVRIPLNSSDFSSFLLQAQSSKAKVIGLANAGLDTTNSIKQAAEFGIVNGGQKLAALLMTLAEVHGLGLQAAQGLVLTEGFYWDRDDKSRAFGERFMRRTDRMPSMIHAGTYSATLSYLKAVKAAGTKDSDAVAKKLKELPVDDAFAQGKVLENGRMVHDLYLFEVKKPSESKKPWDYYKQLAVVPGEKAFPSAKESGCPLTK